MAHSHTPKPAPAEAKNEKTPEELYTELLITGGGIVIRGQQGMLQHHFSDQASAGKFLKWIQTQPLPDINKARINSGTSNGKPTYIVRLTQAQYDLLCTLSNKPKPPPEKKLSPDEIKRVANILCDSTNLTFDKFKKIADEENELFNAALLLLSPEDQSIFTKCINCEPQEQYAAYTIEKATPATIDKAILMPDKNKDTVLHRLFYNKSEELCNQLLVKVSVKEMNSALVLQNIHDSTPLMLAMRYQGSKVCGKTLNLASAQTISNNISLAQSRLLHDAFGNHTPEICHQLLDKATPESISAALPRLHGSCNDTALHWVVYEQPEDVVAKTLEKATPAALDAACLILNTRNNSVLELMLGRQPAAVTAKLLNKIGDAALRYMLRTPENSSRIISSVASNILHEPSFQTEPLMSRLFAIVGREIAVFCCEAYIQGKDIPPAVLKAGTQCLKELPQAVYTEWETLGKDAKGYSPLDEKTPTITTQSGTKIAIDTKDEKDLKVMFEEGLHSTKDYRTLKKYIPHAIITQIADDLRRADLLYTGAPSILLDLKKYTPYSLHYLDVINRGDAIFKMVQDKDWLDFDRQLGDYSYRPKLRDQKQDKSKKTHKYHHKTGEIIKFTEHKVKDNKKEYTSTKKQSATLMATQQNTTVFGEYVKDFNLVGVLADTRCHIEFCQILPNEKDRKTNNYIVIDNEEEKGNTPTKIFYIDDNKKAHLIKSKEVDQAITALQRDPTRQSSIETIITQYHQTRTMKALLARDRGTFTRSWIGSQAEAEKYKERMKGINYTNFSDFQKMVNEQHPNRLNEVLYKFTRGGLVAIFVAKDNLASRIIAIERQRTIHQKYKLDLPIVIYDRTLRKTRVYSPREQQDDSKGYNNLKNAYNELKKEVSTSLLEKSENEILNILDKNTIKTISAAIKQEISNRRTTVLHEFFRTFQPETCEKMINKIDTATLHSALAIQQYYQNCKSTPLSEALWHQPSTFCEKLIARITADVLNDIYVKESREAYSSLGVAFDKQSTAICDKLLEMTKAEHLDAILSKKVPENTLLLLYAAILKHPENTVISLIKKASSQALDKACDLTDPRAGTVLDLALRKPQPDSVILELLNKISDDSLKFLLTHSAESRAAIVKKVVSDPNWQREPLFPRLCKFIASEIANFCHINYKQNLPPVILEVARSYFKHNSANDNNYKKLLEISDEKTLESIRKRAKEKTDALTARLDLTLFRKPDAKQIEDAKKAGLDPNKLSLDKDLLSAIYKTKSQLIYISMNDIQRAAIEEIIADEKHLGADFKHPLDAGAAAAADVKSHAAPGEMHSIEKEVKALAALSSKIYVDLHQEYNYKVKQKEGRNWAMFKRAIQCRPADEMNPIKSQILTQIEARLNELLKQFPEKSTWEIYAEMKAFLQKAHDDLPDKKTFGKMIMAVIEFIDGQLPAIKHDQPNAPPSQAR